jgi:hypothetical protein
MPCYEPILGRMHDTPLQVAFRNGVELGRKVVPVRLITPRVLVSLPAGMAYADTLTLTPYQPGYLVNPLLGVITANFGEQRRAAVSVLQHGLLRCCGCSAAPDLPTS